MIQDNNFKIGDKIVDFGQVCRIFKIEKKTLFFKPYFKTRLARNLVCSIPVENINKANLRKPISKKELRALLARLGRHRQPKEESLINVGRLREQLNSNDIFQVATVLSILWVEKNDESSNFSRYKQEIYDSAMSRLVEETAFVAGCRPNQAKKKIDKALKENKLKLKDYLS